MHNSSSNNRRRKKKVWHFLNWNSQLQNTQCSKKHSECFTANPALKHSCVEFHKFGHGNRIAGVGSYHFSVHDAYDGVRWWVRWFHRCHWYSHFQMKMYAIQSFSSFLFPCGRECQLSWILVNRFEIVNLLSCLSLFITIKTNNNERCVEMRSVPLRCVTLRWNEMSWTHLIFLSRVM